MAELNPVPALVVPAVWPHVADMAARAITRTKGRYSMDDVLRGLLERRLQLWIVTHEKAAAAVVLTELVIYPSSKSCKIFAVAGNGLKHWAHLISLIEGWAAQIGCERMEAGCRPGFERVMERFGYRKAAIVLEKELGNA